MAAAIVPIITSLVPVVVPALVRGVEALFPKGSGPAKMNSVLNALKAILGDLGKAGISGAAPSDDALVALIETVVQDLKSKGQLPAPAGTSPTIKFTDGLSGLTVQVAGTLKLI